jgi:Smg protein
MYESMVDVLIYLYETYMDGDTPAPTDQDALEEELSEAGFSKSEIAQALSWLDELASRMEDDDNQPVAAIPLSEGSSGRGDSRSPTLPQPPMRVYSAAEARKLDVEVQGLLLFLEQNGILDMASRELVIERALAIKQPSVSVDEVKWIVLLVLLNRPGNEHAFSQMEALVYSGDAPTFLH